MTDDGQSKCVDVDAATTTTTTTDGRKRGRLDLSRKRQRRGVEHRGSSRGRASQSQSSSSSSSSLRLPTEMLVIDILDSDDDHDGGVNEENEKEVDGDDCATDRIGRHDGGQGIAPESAETTPRNLVTPSSSSSSATETPDARTSPSSPSSHHHHHSPRSSAYVQHLAEACALISTDARWRVGGAIAREEEKTTTTTTTTSCRLRRSICRCRHHRRRTRSELLFSWEGGDDLSAVGAFASLYDGGMISGTTTTTTTEKEEEEGDRAVEGAMHLYSRMYHRRGPWFDLADLFDRYYAPKSSVGGSSDSTERDGTSPAAGERDDYDGGDDEKIRDFFTPRSSRAKCDGRGIDLADRSDDLATHHNALRRLFDDVLRLLSMGLIRSFRSERECGLVAGNVTSGGRGTLLSADERRDVLRRLGGGKSPKVMARAASSTICKNVNGGIAAATSNEILNQMQSQRSVLTSFARSSLGGEARVAMLPVIKHVDRVMIGKLAAKVASRATNAIRKSDLDDATRIIHRSWSAACARHDRGGGRIGLGDSIFTAFRLREAPLRTLRRFMRLFLCAGAGPGAMRGDGTNGWISVMDDESSVDACSSSSKWHNVVYPGLSSRLGLEYYEFGRSYNHIPSTPNYSTGPFSCYCEFQSWELGVEIRSFIDQANEIYEIERQSHRRREKELAVLKSCESLKEESRVGFMDEKNATIRLLTRDGCALLTEAGRRDIAMSILTQSFNDAQLPNGMSLDLIADSVLRQIENDILSLSNSTSDDDCDSFICDTERLIVASAIICHRILQLRIEHPSALLLSLVERPWLRHMCFDAILAYILWDCVPIFERRGHHSMAVSILQTILLGQEIPARCIELSESSLWLAGMKAKPYVECLLPRRNRGKACERLLIDMTHADRRAKKICQHKPEKNAKKCGKKSIAAKEEAEKSPLKSLCEALLNDIESIPFCSLRNLARRSSAPLPQTKERCVLSIRPSGDDWSPKTDSAVANAIVCESSNGGAGKRCAFVGWEIHDRQDEMETHRSLNVEELAMEEYHSGRLPCDEGDEEVVKGQWVGWHNEGGHVRALFRILCLQHLMECCPHDTLGLDEETTVVLTPYQNSPHDLHVGHFRALSGSSVRGFYERRCHAIESFLSDLTQLDACVIGNRVYEAVKQRWDRHLDDRSRLKDPRLLKDVTELKTLSLIASALGPATLSRVFRTLCFDYRHWSGGLPDLFLVRARYEYALPNSVPFVPLANWIGEGFFHGQIDAKIRQSHICMLTDRDDEFLGQPKNADGLSSQNQSSARIKQGAVQVQLPSFPEKLEFVHEGERVNTDCMFVEVKSANDRLSERQEDWLSILEPDARVCKFTNSARGKGK